MYVHMYVTLEHHISWGIYVIHERQIIPMSHSLCTVKDLVH